MVEIVNFTKCYGKKTAVDNLNLTIQQGDVVGIIGNNGAGKSTTLKACMGIIQPSQGDIIINNHSMNENPIDCKKDLAYVPDTPMLEEYMTGTQYLNFICDMYGVSSNQRRGILKTLINEFNMENVIDSLISSYSLGMKQKTAIIAAFSHNPKVLILDEPFVGLDPKAVMILKEKIIGYSSEGGTVLFSSHILDVVEKLCNRVVIIREGQLLYSGLTSCVQKINTLEKFFAELNNADSSNCKKRNIENREYQPI